MVFHSKISDRERALACYLRKGRFLSFRKIAEHCKISVSSVVRICKEGPSTKQENKRTGRPPLMSKRDKARFLRTFKKMRETNGNVRVMDVAKEWQITHVSYRTLVRALHDAGYRFLNPRKKGILSAKDRRKRVSYARDALKKHDRNFWTDDVLMYLDGVSFHHKQNPYNDALCPRGRVWRTKKEGLVFTSKGSKNLPGGRTLHLLVGVSYSAGVVVAEEYEKMNARWFAKFVHETFDSTLRECAAMKKKEKLLFVMDNDPSQRSKLASDALEEVGAELVEIPARSPDLNPIENLFNIIKCNLRQEALRGKIVKEDFQTSKGRVLQAFSDFDVTVIDRTIRSMHDRLSTLAINDGYRTKY